MASMMPPSLDTIYQALRQHFGSFPDWWPIVGADPPFEMLLGAVLVQQTRWETVEGAIGRLQAAGLLTPTALAQATSADLAHLIKPTAFYRQKAAGLIGLSRYICTHYAGSTATLLRQPTDPLRRELLELPRIGPETADVFLLYAGAHPVFVVDGYLRRLLGRVGVLPAGAEAGSFDWARARYEQVRALVEQELTQAVRQSPQSTPDGVPPRDQAECVALYADYHALVNEACVRYCLARRPRCDGPPARRVYSQQVGRESYLQRQDGCPLRAVCAFYQATQAQQPPAGG